MTRTKSTPLASVVVSSYNQAHLIHDTVKGVLSQRTSFPFEVIVTDDASKDDSILILQSLVSSHENLTLLRQSKNLGVVANVHSAIDVCRGKFIALNDGDDIWIDETKLERQVTFLRKNPQFSLSHTHIEVFNHQTKVISKRKPGTISRRQGDLFINLMTKGNFITTSTAVFNKDFLSEDDLSDLRNFRTQDYPLWLTLASKGKIHFLPEACVRYRVIQGSVGRPFKPSIEQLEAGINASREIALHFASGLPISTPVINKINARNDLDILRMLVLQGQANRAKKFASEISLRTKLTNLRILKYCFRTTLM